MKKLTLVFALTLILAVSAFAQMDTLVVPLEGGQGFLKEFVDENGAGHVYKLQRGGYYWMTGQILNEFPLVIVGETQPADERPAP